MTLRVTRAIALAASHDAGNRSMRRARRIKWDESDWNAAADCFAALYPSQPEPLAQDNAAKVSRR